jgi:hemerythrin
MSLVWDRSLECGVAAIDQQHEELYRAIGELLRAMQENRGREEVVRVVTFLKSYVVKHFGMEEQLMRLHRYPKAAEHAAEHRRFVADFRALEAELLAKGASALLVIQVNRRVCAWLRDHIAHVDRELGAFLSSPRDAAARRAG